MRIGAGRDGAGRGGTNEEQGRVGKVQQAVRAVSTHRDQRPGSGRGSRTNPRPGCHVHACGQAYPKFLALSVVCVPVSSPSPKASAPKPSPSAAAMKAWGGCAALPFALSLSLVASAPTTAATSSFAGDPTDDTAQANPPTPKIPRPRRRPAPAPPTHANTTGALCRGRSPTPTSRRRLTHTIPKQGCPLAWSENGRKISATSSTCPHTTTRRWRRRCR